MRKIFILAFFIIGSLALQAQDLNWHTDVREAIAISNKEKNL